MNSAQIRAFDSTFLVTAPSSDQANLQPKALFNETFSLSRNTSLPSLVGYDFYSAEVTNGLGPSSITADFEANVTEVSTGSTKTVRLDFVKAIDPDRAAFMPVPPLATISKVNLTSAGTGTALGSDAVVSALPLAGTAFYALLGFLGALIYIA